MDHSIQGAAQDKATLDRFYSIYTLMYKMLKMYSKKLVITLREIINYVFKNKKFTDDMTNRNIPYI